MNKLRDIIDRCNIVKKDLAEAFEVHPNTINYQIDKPLDMLTVRQLIALKNLTGLSFNELLGENLINEADNTQPKRTTLSQKQAKDLLIKLLDQIEVPSDEHKDLIIK